VKQCTGSTVNRKIQRQVHQLLFNSVGHELLFCALWADNVLSIRDEPLPNHAGLAGTTDEAVVVPVSSLEGNESSATDTSDRFTASCASLGEQFSEAVSTIWFVVSRSEPLSSQRLLTVCAGEAFPVPRVITVSYSTLGDHLTTLDTFGSELLFIALCAINVVFLGNKAFGANRVLAGTADEAFLMPLSGLVFHLLHTGLEYISTAVTSCSKLCIIAGATVDPVSLGSELFVH